MTQQQDEYDAQTVFPLPWWAVLICLIFVPLWGCATAPQMPPAVPETIVASFDAPHTNGRLYAEPCLNLTIMEFLRDKLEPEVLATVRAATGTYQGQKFGVCWLWNVDESAAVVIWDDGGYFQVPKSLLQTPLGV